MDSNKIQVKPLSGKSDWPIWKYRIRFVLNCRADALEVVEGTLPNPDEPEAGANAAARQAYDAAKGRYGKANNYAMMVLTNSMTEETVQKIIRFVDAREAWLELHKIYEDSSDNQLYHTCMRFFQEAWENGDMAAHLSKLKNLWEELNKGLEMKRENRLPEMLLICKILDSLPPCYRPFKSTWLLLSDEKRTLDELTTQLCSHERELKKDSVPSIKNDEQEALVTQETKIKISKNSKCAYCHRKGHWVKTCKKWIADGRPPKASASHSRDGGSRVAANYTLVALDEEVNSSESGSEDWFIDNGASKHVTNSTQYFFDFEKFQSPHSITVASGKALPAVGKGKINIVTDVKGDTHSIVLKNVWFVPEISKNLFSVLAAQDENQNSVFESTYKDCVLKIGGIPVLHGTRSAGGGLFKAAMTTLPPDRNITVDMATEDVLQLYHERWGHQDKRHVKAVLERELDLKVKLETAICEPCAYGKTHRLKFGQRKKATSPGELITTDICGPFDESHRKFRYFAIFKDSFTKFRYCYFLKHKSEIQDIVGGFINHAKNLGHNVREILSDNGGEFDCENVRKVLRELGVTQRLTSPYCPEQNGSTERDNRTIVEMARTLKYGNREADFPKSLWAEFVSTSVYVLNRTGKSSVPDTTPFELWMGKKPRIRHMRIIGCVCFAHIPSQKRKKMDKKAVKGYLIGYDGDERYRIYIKETGTVTCSRDVVFDEKPSTSNQETCLPYPYEHKDPEKEDPEESSLEDPEKSGLEDPEESSQEPCPGKNPEDARPRRQRNTPKWTKDFVMEDSLTYDELAVTTDKQESS